MKLRRLNTIRLITSLLLVLFILTPALAKDVKIGVFYDKTQSLAFKDGLMNRNSTGMPWKRTAEKLWNCLLPTMKLQK